MPRGDGPAVSAGFLVPTESIVAAICSVVDKARVERLEEPRGRRRRRHVAREEVAQHAHLLVAAGEVHRGAAAEVEALFAKARAAAKRFFDANRLTSRCHGDAAWQSVAEKGSASSCCRR